MAANHLEKFSWISILVIIALIGATILPDYSQVYAGEKARQEQINQKHEIVELRTKNSKTYLKGDHTYVLEEYLEPIHFKEKGQWKEIDNGIQSVSSTQAMDEDLPYENTANRYRVGFAPVSRADTLLRFQLDSTAVKFSLVDGENVMVEKKGNRIAYNNIYPDTHLVYYTDNASVKEEWILDKYHGQNKLTMALDTEGVEANKQPDGSIDFVDTKGKTAFSIPRPFMVDKNLRYSGDIQFHIREEGDKTTLILEMDEKWLQDPERAYPVTVDPSLVIQGASKTQDTFVGDKQPTTNFGALTYVTVGNNPDHGISRALLKFDLQPLLSSATITSAKLSIYQTNTSTKAERENLHPIAETWSETKATWNKQPSVGAAISNQTVTDAGWYDFYLTALARDWYTGKTANYGVSLRHATETNNRKSYYSSEFATDPAKKPKLTITYEIDPIGEESFWTSTVSDINTYNGNLVVGETDVTILGRGVEATIDRTYNSRSSFNGKFGYGWISSLEQGLKFNGDSPVLYTDPDGTPHTFIPNGDGTYRAPAGVYLDLIKRSTGTFYLMDKDQTQFNFNTSGRLTSIVDSNNNKTAIGYTGSNPTSITDASGRKISLTYNADNRVTKVTDPVNRTIEYSYDTNGNLGSVTKKDAAGNVLTTIKYEYDQDHHLTAIIDPNGNKKTIGYDGENRVVSLSTPLTINRTAETATNRLSYDAVNKTTTVTNPKGKKTVYTHNEYGNVIQTTEDPGGFNYKHTYQYNDKNELISEKDANANASGSMATYDYTYDEKGNLTSVTNPLKEKETTVYDDKNNPIKETDPQGNKTVNEYDDKGNPTSSTDPVEKSTATKVDAYGNVIEETTPMSPGDNLARNGSFEIDRNSDNWPEDWYQWTASGAKKVTWTNGGLVVDGITLGEKRLQIVSPGEDTLIGNSKLIPYDPKKAYFVSGYVSTSSAKGIAGIQATGYDANGNITKRIKSNEISGTHSPTRLHAAVEPDAFPTGTTTFRIRAYVFGKNGQYDGTYRFDGLQVEEGFYGAYNLVENSGFERDDDPKDTVPDRWFMSAETEAADGVTTTEKHTGKSSGKLVGKTTLWKSYYQDLPVSGAAGAIFTVSGFSKVSSPKKDGGIYGYIIKTYQGSTEQETFTYHFNKSKSHDWEHKAAQIKATKPFDRIRVHFEYSQQTGTAWFDTAKVTVGSIHSKSVYDDAGNYEIQSVNPEGKTTDTTYDGVGNVLTEKEGSDITTSVYDGLNRLTKVTDAKNNSIRYEYDANGNQTKVINAKNKATVYEYNEIDQVKKATDALNRVTRYEYDLSGNETQVTDPKGNEVTYGYDAVDRKTSVSYNGTKRYSFEYDPNGNVTKETDHSKNESTSFVYDADDKLKSESEGNGPQTEYVYDKNGNVTELKHTIGSTILTQSLGYNRLDQLTQVNENGKARAWVTYDEADRVASRKSADGSVALYRYNGAGDLVEQVNLDSAGKVRGRYTYTYDAKGNRSKEVSTGGTTSYAYDELEQLTKETRPDGTVTEYTYDSVGNRLTKKVTQGGTTDTTTYSYDDANQLTAVNGTDHTHDANGNLTQDGHHSYEYDVEDRLIAVKDSKGNPLASFTYRADGMRKTMTTASGTITFHYDQDKNVTYETDENNQVVASYTYGPANQPVSMTRGGETYYYQLNGHGDVTALTDSTGAVVATYEYDAWGNVIKETGTVDNPYRYLGYRYDKVTKLYYLQARYYNPDTGRFLTLDPDPGDEDDALTQNGYTYANNNPVMLADPDGEWVWLAINAGFAAYDGYKAYKRYKKQGKRGAALWGRVAWAAGSNFIKVGKVAKALNFAKRSSHSVYVLKNSKGVVKYVGRTKNVSKRRWAHSKKHPDLSMDVRHSGLSYKQARGIEHWTWRKYRKNGLRNKIRPISKKNKKKRSYYNAAKSYLRNHRWL